MKKLCSKLPLAALFLILQACTLGSGEDGIQIFSASFDFGDSDHGWKHGFADYPAGPNDSVFYELKYAYKETPSTVVPEQKAIMLSGNNHSDDLFMFIKKKVDGLQPNTDYTLTFHVELASEAREDLLGAGGAPGTGVYLKAGASSIEPRSVIDQNYVVMNIDKGNQSTSGAHMIRIGDISTPSNTSGYTLISRNNTMSNALFVARSNAAGELWLIVGTDSGFEGITTVYYTLINVVFSTAD